VVPTITCKRIQVLHCAPPASTHKVNQPSDMSANGQGDAGIQGTAENKLGGGERGREDASEGEEEVEEDEDVEGGAEGETSVPEQWDLVPGPVALRTRGKQKLLQEESLYEVERIEMSMVKNGVSRVIFLDCPVAPQIWFSTVCCLRKEALRKSTAIVLGENGLERRLP
jgi:hypothetical protein